MQIQPLPNYRSSQNHGPATCSVIPQGKGLDLAPRPVPAHLPVPSCQLWASHVMLWAVSEGQGDGMSWPHNHYCSDLPYAYPLSQVAHRRPQNMSPLQSLNTPWPAMQHLPPPRSRWLEEDCPKDVFQWPQWTLSSTVLSAKSPNHSFTASPSP